MDKLMTMLRPQIKFNFNHQSFLILELYFSGKILQVWFVSHTYNQNPCLDLPLTVQ